MTALESGMLTTTLLLVFFTFPPDLQYFSPPFVFLFHQLPMESFCFALPLILYHFFVHLSSSVLSPVPSCPTPISWFPPICLLRPGSGGWVRQRWMRCRPKRPPGSILKESHHQPTIPVVCQVRPRQVTGTHCSPFAFRYKALFSDHNLTSIGQDVNHHRGCIWTIFEPKRWAFSELEYLNLLLLVWWQCSLLKEHVCFSFTLSTFCRHLYWKLNASFCQALPHLNILRARFVCFLFCKTWNVCNYFEKSMCSLKKSQLQSVQSDRLKAFM